MPDSILRENSFIIELSVGLILLGITSWNSFIWYSIKKLRDDLDYEKDQRSHEVKLCMGKISDHLVESEGRLTALESTCEDKEG